MSSEKHEHPQDQKEWELIAGDVLGDLSEEERSAFEDLGLERYRESSDELAKTAAALHLVFENPAMESMPDRLRTKILADAPAYLESAHQRSAEPRGVVKLANVISDDANPEDGSPTPVSPRNGPARGSLSREMFAWFAFAATFVAAMVLWNRESSIETVAALTPNEARAELMQTANDVTTVAWSEGKTPFDATVEGDVVWSNASQSGFMRFVGMPVNDPTVEQYQLWIIDPERDDEPIDGGVFDVGTTGETVIPIDAKLAVLKPAAFAITIEKPGGVVVSDQERLPLIAAL